MINDVHKRITSASEMSKMDFIPLLFLVRKLFCVVRGAWDGCAVLPSSNGFTIFNALSFKLIFLPEGEHHWWR